MNTPVQPEKNILMPDSEAPRKLQYDFAWQNLLNQNAHPNDRAQAKCWLTYRTTDQEIPLQDWIEKIKPVIHGDNSLRWKCSQATAEAYLYLLVAGDHDAFLTRATMVHDLVREGLLEQHPGACLNYLRMSALLAYGEYLHGDESKAATLIEITISMWRGMWRDYVPSLQPFRFAEMRGDCAVLHCMMRMLQRMGRIEAGFRAAQWADSILDGEAGLPWWKCLHRLSVSPRAMWLPNKPAYGSLVECYRTIHADNPKYGSGPSAEEVEQIKGILDKAGINDPHTVIDYGCGNSKLAVTLFPNAIIRLYDPAIEELSVLPTAWSYDLGLCTDVMEHIPEQDIAAMWAEMKALTPTWYFTIHTGQASQLLPDGRNAHVTQKPAEWWQQTLGGNIVWQKGVRFGLLV